MINKNKDKDPIFNTETFKEMNTRVAKEDNIIKHPKHYTKGIEMWDYAHSHDLGFFEGNILKYITRWKTKNGVEDLLKAKQYLDKLIKNNSK